MTQQLEHAFEKASKLSEIEQNIFAKFVIDELESEQKWDIAFSESEDILTQLAIEAIDDYKNNNSEKLNINML